MEKVKHEGIFYLSEDDYQKALGQLKRNAYGIFDFLKVDEKLPVRYIYGAGAYIPGAVAEMVKLAEDFSLRCRGAEKPVSIEYVRRKK